jgi:cyclophilin family peptidyl-prolyl cis-trans isomerase
LTDWHQYSTLAQIVGEFAAIEPTSDVGKAMKSEAPGVLRPLATAYASADPVAEAATIKAGPDVLQAYARFKTDDLGELARTALQNKDVQMRATAAGILADIPASKENVDALKTAFTKALLTDKRENDAQLAMMDAMFKLDKKESVGTLLVALNATDYLVRNKAFELLADKDLQVSSPGLPTLLENARAKHKDQVLPYSPAFGTKLGQVLNTDIDYRRALSRKNGSVKAVLTTEKGTFTIDFLPEDAPLTVDNFIKLARVKYFDGLEVHRVVPNFVMQDGDPRGDGNGGPGWSIRCEMNMVPYERGAVGMALSGKDTGGSQWFVTHSPQPHLDGGYTVFGRVNETDMKVVDSIVRGDKILTVRILGK